MHIKPGTRGNNWDDQKLQPLVAEISWTKNVIIMERCKDDIRREFYIRTTKKFGWTKDVHEREYYLRMTAEMGWSRVDKLPKPEELEKQIMQELEGVSD